MPVKESSSKDCARCDPRALADLKSLAAYKETKSLEPSAVSMLLLILSLHAAAAYGYTTPYRPSCFSSTSTPRMTINGPISHDFPSPRRRHAVSMMAGGFLSGLFGDDNNSSGGNYVANAAGTINAGNGPTNEVVKSVNGMKLRRLGGSDILVSELGLGTQRW